MWDHALGIFMMQEAFRHVRSQVAELRRGGTWAQPSSSAQQAASEGREGVIPVAPLGFCFRTTVCALEGLRIDDLAAIS